MIRLLLFYLFCMLGFSNMAKANADVTFCVDLSCFSVSDATAVAFGFSSFAPTNFLSDPDGDRVYCGTFNVPAGELEFKFFFAQEQFENLNASDECVNAAGNRVITVEDGVSQTVTYGWEVCEETCPTVSTTDVTFCVDLACFTVSDAVAVAGSFNGFSPGVNFLSDPDGDRTYCVTVGVPAGEQEFKFFFAQEQFENLNPEDECVNEAGNRVITVEQGVPQTVTYGWEVCEESCPVASTTDITFCVDLSCFPVSDAVAVAGSFNGFSPGANFLADGDGDRIYCGTVGVPAGEQEFKFFFAQEQFESLNIADECVNAAGNRVITVEQDVPQTVTFGWESCDEVCSGPANVTFCVNLNCTDLDPSTVNIFGQFNGFNPTANPMQDEDGDGVYCTTIEMPSGNQEYLFLADGVAESFSVGDPCTVSCCGGAFTNRLIVVENGQDQMVSFDWESCDASCVFPSPWMRSDINCEDGSSAGFDTETETFTLESAGCTPMNYNNDAAAYVKFDLCGDGEIIAQVTSITPFRLGYAGISMRESEAAGSKKVALSTSLGNFGRREVRMVENGPAFPQIISQPNATWLRLVRTGNRFTGFMSMNGTSWRRVLTTSVSMGYCIQLGLFVTSPNVNSTVTATFDNVSISGGSMALAAYEGSIETTIDNSAPADFTIAPNPATNEVYLNLEAYYGQKAQIDVLNLLGKSIQTQQFQEVGSDLQRIDLNGLSGGVYFIRVRTKDGDASKQLLIVD